MKNRHLRDLLSDKIKNIKQIYVSEELRYNIAKKNLYILNSNNF